MARRFNRLSARSAATILKPGRHADGGNLYLVVDANGAKRWSFLFRWEGKLREMGLGGLTSVPLGTARQLAADCRASVAAGRDPIADRRSTAPKALTFGAYVERFLETRSAGWRNAKHRGHWRMTLTHHAAPLTSKAVDAISTEDVLDVLKPIWLAKSETASRLRGRIEHVLDAARATGHRGGENPARWRGHLDKLLPKRRKLTKGHHAALPYSDLPAFMVTLRAGGGRRGGIGSLAFEFLILTAARTGEVLGAQWSEVDRAAKVWTVPGARMKGGRDHRVPLCDRALAILDEAERLRSSDFIFPGQRPGKGLSGMVFEMALRRMKVENATPHGFRSTFRDWAGNETSFAREVAEAALAHAVGDETELAYRRGDALEKRRKLMDAWARFCEPRVASNVVALRERASP